MFGGFILFVLSLQYQNDIIFNLMNMENKEFAFKGNVPSYYTRMRAVERTLQKEGITTDCLLMDTKFASIAGMCFDETALKLNSFIAIDIGNGHTTAASIENNKIQGIFEHHTSSLTPVSLENYIKRLEKLEEIANSFDGVEKCYAIQSGREVRIMVKPEDVNDDGIRILAKEIAKRIEEQMEYPGQIRVNVIRETRSTEYAK